MCHCAHTKYLSTFTPGCHFLFLPVEDSHASHSHLIYRSMEGVSISIVSEKHLLIHLKFCLSSCFSAFDVMTDCLDQHLSSCDLVHEFVLRGLKKSYNYVCHEGFQGD